MRTLNTIKEIKEAVDQGLLVRCNGGDYKVIKDKLGQYLIKSIGNNNCVGLHGEGQYSNTLNGFDFYSAIKK